MIFRRHTSSGNIERNASMVAREEKHKKTPVVCASPFSAWMGDPRCSHAATWVKLFAFDFFLKGIASAANMHHVATRCISRIPPAGPYHKANVNHESYFIPLVLTISISLRRSCPER